MCFTGTKIRVETLFNYLCDGGTIDEFLEEFEGAVKREQAVCAIEMAAQKLVQGLQDRANTSAHHNISAPP